MASGAIREIDACCATRSTGYPQLTIVERSPYANKSWRGHPPPATRRRRPPTSPLRSLAPGCRRYGAATVLETVLAIQRGLGIGWNESGGVGLALCNLGRAFRLQGENKHALDSYQESLPNIQSGRSDYRTTTIVLCHYGYAALTQHDLAGTAECFHRGLELWQIAGRTSYASHHARRGGQRCPVTWRRTAGGPSIRSRGAI